jgi:hypothetical protein
MNRFVPIVAFALATAVAAHAGVEYDCWWSSIDGGGGMSTGGAFELSGTIGQWDAGPVTAAAMTGGTFELMGGFWAEQAPSCLADLDGSGDVAAPDLTILLGAWGFGGAADFDHNGAVNAADLTILLGAWGDCP